MKTLLENLKEQVKREQLSTHMPGHKYRPLHDTNWYQIDTTEVDGADNLFSAKGILKQSMHDIAQIYGAAESRLLINGSTVGLMAAILANTEQGDTIIIARDAHKAVFNACQIGKLNFQTAMPILSESGLSLGYDCAEIIAQLATNLNIKVVVLMSPTYYGYTTDIQPLVEVLNARGGVLIIDEAHGAHLKFCQNGGSTLDGGAHIVVQSAHKMLAAMTQSALLHFSKDTDQAVIKKVDHYLEMLQSSSPSYVLMSSIDYAVKDMQANQQDHLAFESEMRTLITNQLTDWLAEQKPQDPFKLWLETARHGYSGFQFEKLLQQSGIFAELINDWGLLLYLSHYNTIDDLNQIVKSVQAIPKKAPYQATHIAYKPSTARLMDTNNYKITSVALAEAEGCYIAEDIIPYPPGIRFVMRGEKLTQAQIKTIIKLRNSGHTIIGTADKTVQKIRIYKEK